MLLLIYYSSNACFNNSSAYTNENMVFLSIRFFYSGFLLCHHAVSPKPRAIHLNLRKFETCKNIDLNLSTR